MVSLNYFAGFPDQDPNRAPRPLRILLVDDDTDMVMTLSVILRDEGHIVSHAYTGGEALQAAQRYAPEVCILDIYLPGASGYDVARKLREQYGKKIVLIAITGVYKKQSDLLLAQIVGFDHHLGKPFEPSELVEILKSVSSSPRSS
jgi:CheY-like chemotaxis protein